MLQTPSAAGDTVKHVKINYTDYTGTAGGTAWHQIGKRPRAEGRRTMQPPPSGTLFHRGERLNTLAILWWHTLSPVLLHLDKLALDMVPFKNFF